MKVQTAAALCAAFLLCGCFEDTKAGMNKDCTSYCFSFNGVENDSPAALEAKIKQTCEKMGRHGKPEIKEQTKSAVAGFCPE